MAPKAVRVNMVSIGGIPLGRAGKREKAGEMVILDNLPAHKVSAARDAIRDALPRFSAKECTNYFIAAGDEPE